MGLTPGYAEGMGLPAPWSADEMHGRRRRRPLEKDIARRDRLRWLLLMFLAPLVGNTAAGAVPLPAGVKPDLPVHQQKKRNPEISDPVLEDRAAIVE